MKTTEQYYKKYRNDNFTHQQARKLAQLATLLAETECLDGESHIENCKHKV